MPQSEFEWQIDGDESVDAAQADEPAAPERDAPAAVPVQEAPQPRNWLARTTVSVATLAVLTGIAAAAIVSRQTEQIVAPIREDILATHRIVSQAVAQSDRALFASFLPEGDYSWEIAARGLFERAGVWDRRPFGLELQDTDPRVVDVVISPELARAEVVVERAYAVQAGSGLAETAHLRQAALYEFDERGWVWAAPDREFWGVTLTVNGRGRFLSLSFPERDEAVSRRLAHDLDDMLESACSAPGGACPADLHVDLRFNRSASGLVEALDDTPQFVFGSNLSRELVLPAPAWIGVPGDDAGYRALYRYYAIRVLQTAFAHLGGEWLDGQAQRIREAEVRRQLVRLGLQAWPGSLPEQRNPAVSFPPGQDIQLYCVEGLARGGNLLRYTPSTGAWTTELSGRWILSMLSHPQGDGVVVREQSLFTDTQSSRIVLRQAGRESILLSDPGDERYVAYFGPFDPTGRKLAAILRVELIPGIGVPPPAATSILLDLNDCDPAGCRSKEIVDWPRWSPDGRHALMMDSESHTLRLVNEEAELLREIQGADNPFWLDNETYGYFSSRYFRSDFPSEFRIMISTITGDDAEVLLTSGDLLPLLPEDERPNRLIDRYAVVNPADPRQLLVRIVPFQGPYGEPRSSETAYFFLFDRRSGEARLWRPFASAGVSPRFSPDGRWLITSIIDRDNRFTQTVFQDVEHMEREPLAFHYPSFSLPPAISAWQWSTGGQWLLVLQDGILHLLSPAYGEHRTIVPESPGCIFAAWINA